MNLKVVMLCGFAGSGKDTVADMFVNAGFMRMSMADPLKDAMSNLFMWDRDMLQGITTPSRKWRETPVPHHSTWGELLGSGIFSNDTTLTPRLAMQRMGTDLFRKHVHPDFWCMSMKARIEAIDDPDVVGVIIPDGRFLNELNMADITINVNRHTYSPTEIEQMHISEKEHLAHDCDYVIYNTRTLSHLEIETKAIVDIILQ